MFLPSSANLTAAVATALLAASTLLQSSSLDSFVASEVPIAYQGILANTGTSSGSTAQGAKAGVIIASPSTVNPNYLYTWTRDAALTAQALVDRLITTGDVTIETTLNSYVAAQQIIQQISNPSGTFTTGGLAEPKYNIDETAFTGAWGRPQRDGPGESLRPAEIYHCSTSYLILL